MSGRSKTRAGIPSATAFICWFRHAGRKTGRCGSTRAARKGSAGWGGYPELGLREAQRKAAYFKDRVRLGFDPWLEPTLEARLAKPTFEKAARTYYSEHKPRWKPGKHRDKWLRPLEQYAFPKIGSMPVDEIRKADVLDVAETDVGQEIRDGTQDSHSNALDLLVGHRS